MPTKRGRRVPITTGQAPPSIITPCPHCGAPMRVLNGAWLRGLREKAGLPVRAFAARVGLSSAYISDIERNRRACPAPIEEYYAALTEDV